MNDAKQSNLRRQLPRIKDFTILVTFFTCFLGTIVKISAYPEESQQIFVENLEIRDYDDKRSLRVTVQFLTHTLSRDARRNCFRRGLPRRCTFALAISVYVKSQHQLFLWSQTMVIVVGSNIQKFPYTYKFLNRLGDNPNPLRLDLDMMKDRKLQNITVKVSRSTYSVKVTRATTIIFKDSKPEFTLQPGQFKTLVSGQNTTSELVLRINYTVVYCNDTAPVGKCGGHFRCGANGKRICQPYYYGYHCKRHCKPIPGIRSCSSDGYYTCERNYFGTQCMTHCKANTSYRCDNNGSMICLKGYLKADNKCISWCQDRRQCLNGGWCQLKYAGDMSCFCAIGWGGKRCERATCRYLYCKHGGTCVEENGERKCRCLPPYVGHNCEVAVRCSYKGEAWCLNLSECSHRGTQFICHCLSGFYGNRCEHRNTFGKEIDEDFWLFSSDFDSNHIVLLSTMIICAVYTAVIIWFCGPKVLDGCF